MDGGVRFDILWLRVACGGETRPLMGQTAMMTAEMAVIISAIGTCCIAVGFYRRSKILSQIGHLVISSYLMLAFIFGLRWEFAAYAILFLSAGFVYKRDAEPWRSYFWVAIVSPYYFAMFMVTFFNTFWHEGWLDQFFRWFDQL